MKAPPANNNKTQEDNKIGGDKVEKNNIGGRGAEENGIGGEMGELGSVVVWRNVDYFINIAII